MVTNFPKTVVQNSPVGRRIEEAKNSKDLAEIIKAIDLAKEELNLTNKRIIEIKKRNKKVFGQINSENLKKHCDEHIEEFEEKREYLEKSIKFLEDKRKYLEKSM